MTGKQSSDVRAVAAQVVVGVLQGQSLSNLLSEYNATVANSDCSLLKELCFGTLRWYPQIAIIIDSLLTRPLRNKDLPVHGLIACGLYQLMHMRIADHAVVNETVTAVVALKRHWAKGLVNGVLRNFQRNRQQLLKQHRDNPVFQMAHPLWIIENIHASQPMDIATQAIAANNHQAPMTLRVNQNRESRENYLRRLSDQGINASATPHSQQGVLLDTPVDVFDLPGFTEGLVSVQDEAPQLAAELLLLESGQRVLDACCAPGGKTCHILEMQPDLEQLVAVDLKQQRMSRVTESLNRLGLHAQLAVADAGDLSSWWDGRGFDRILLDAPCSGSGVIRRHPDIKILRRSSDIDKLTMIQVHLLNNIWQTLSHGGILLYATCSVFAQENDATIGQFLANHSDAKLLTIDAQWGLSTQYGRQLIPEQRGNDGFYYSRLQKKSDSEIKQ